MNKWRLILPRVVATLTRRNRYIPEFKQWDALFVNNVFRIYEQVFGRDYRIRKESSTSFDGVKTTHEFYTLESLLAFMEGSTRRWVMGQAPLPRPLALAFSMAGFLLLFKNKHGDFIPFVSMAIAHDADATYNGGATTTATQTWTHTDGSGSNRLLVVCWGTGSNRTHDSASYNSVAMTKQTDVARDAYFRDSIWTLVAPATGANTVSVTASNTAKMGGVSSTWSGIDQTTPIGITGTNNAGSGTTLSVTVTTTGTNSYVVDLGFANHNSGGLTKDASQTLIGKIYNSSDTWNIGSSYKSTPSPGSVTMQWTFTTSDSWISEAIEILPISTFIALPPYFVPQAVKRSNYY